jgi:hypothetical protein
MTPEELIYAGWSNVVEYVPKDGETFTYYSFELHGSDRINYENGIFVASLETWISKNANT